MVEVVTAALEDQLIDPLSFRLTPTASYVTRRASATYHTQGSNIYSSRTGTRLIKILVSGSGQWLDPSTFHIIFDLKNDDVAAANAPHKLYPLSGPHAFFSRVRILINGTQVEDISEYARVHEMFDCFSSTDNVDNSYAIGFGNNWKNEVYSQDLTTTTTSVVAIPAGSSMTVMFKPCCGLFNTIRKYLPLQIMPIVIELSLVDNPLDPIIYTGVNRGVAAVDSGPFFTEATSNLWSIVNVQAKCDLVTLDSSFEEDFYRSLSEGKPLNIGYNTFINQTQTITGMSNLNVNVSRSLTRLKSVFVSLSKALTGTSATTLTRTVDRYPGSKEWNEFFSPMFREYNADVKENNPDHEFEMQLSIGSALYPEYPIRSHSEAYANLKKTLGIRSNSVHGFNINAVDYRTNKMIIGIDTEKVLEASYSGLSLRQGDLMTVMFKYYSDGGANQPILADRMHIILVADQILEVHSHGVRVLD